MVKVLFLSLLVAMMCGLASTLPAPQLARSFRQELFVSTPPSTNSVLEDPATRNERSTNLSFITGTARKIQLFIKNRHLQLLPDGTVNGTDDASSVYTILQRMTVGVGKMKIQGVATCQYLCMDCVGMMYGSREFTDECVFNELIELNHYNTYYSTKYSNDKRTFYLALNGKGQPKKIILRSNQQLGHRASFTRGITLPADKLADSTSSTHPLRHHAHLCSVLATESSNSREEQSTRTPTRCPKNRKKKKKKKKKCEHCSGNNNNNKSSGATSMNAKRHNKNRLNKLKKCENNKNSEECQRAGINNNNNNKKRQKKFGGDKQQQTVNNKKKKKNNLKTGAKNKKRLLTTTTTEVPSTVVTVTTEEGYHDEDYAVDNSTHWDWDGTDSSTVSSHPEESTSSSTTSTIITDPD